jgi:hypothetical protein
MGIVRKIVNGRRVTEVVEAVRALDEVMPPLPDPEKLATTQAESSVVEPTPMGGLSCIVRAAELVGFVGIVGATASAALVGRWRR